MRLVDVSHQADQPFEQLEDDLLEPIFDLRWSLLEEPLDNDIKSLLLVLDETRGITIFQLTFDAQGKETNRTRGGTSLGSGSEARAEILTRSK